MVTVRFEANGLRPDVARFDTPEQAEAAIVNLIHRRHRDVPLRIRASYKGRVFYRFDRRAAGEG